jgi:TRAP-type C4-dicarboxylate transport system permease small subunit
VHPRPTSSGARVEMADRFLGEISMKILRNIDYYLQPVIFIAMLLVLGAQILYRFIPNLSIPWTLELITFLFGASIWFGISIAIKEDAHVGITFLINFLPPEFKRLVKLIHNLLFGLFLTFVGWFGTQSLIYYIEKGMRTPAMQISYFIVRAPLFVGCLLSIYRLIEKSICIGKMSDADIEKL